MLSSAVSRRVIGCGSTPAWGVAWGVARTRALGTATKRRVLGGIIASNDNNTAGGRGGRRHQATSATSSGGGEEARGGARGGDQHEFRMHDSMVPLTDTQRQLKEAIFKFAQKEIQPLAQQLDDGIAAPPDMWRKMGDMGLLGITAPVQYGGMEMGYLENCIAMEELSRACASVGLSYAAHSNLCVSQIDRNGNAAQKQFFLPKLVSGEHIGALCISEEEAGSDVVSMKTTAVKKGKHFVLNGSKMWITNGDIADVYIVYAKTNPVGKQHGITAFLVNKKSKGLRANPPLDKLGMRGSNTCQLFFENVEVPEENILGQVDKGIYVLMSGLDYERLALSAGPLGIMQSCVDNVMPYVALRKQFGKPLSSFQLIQAKLADMYTSLCASRAFVYSTAKAVDEKQLDQSAITRSCASAFLFSAEHATQVALQAIQCLGSSGYMNEYPLGRLLRDAKLYEIGGGTTEIRRLVIAKELAKQLVGL
ncbi:acyl-CoA dehydrogenase/oxidase [Pelomyxa schiedti]|nr:acyl-CoA dehydrogenase/oxidase [Pelomyxa schiedti]